MTNSSEDIIQKGVEAALALAEADPWAELTLADIAAEAGLELSDFHGIATKEDIAAAVEPYMDEAMSAEPVDMEDPPRERLFDVIMRRFEKMEDHRIGMLSLQHWRERNPRRLAKLGKARLETARWALACAGMDRQGDMPMGLRAAGLAWVLARTERAWRKEDSADFSRTMAELDKQLRQAEERIGWISRFTGRARAPEDAAGAV